ncbi:MAG: twin-arginine translocase TatA/TatE family subunit [Bacteroidales bacterium]
MFQSILFISGPEIIIIFLFILVFFGANKIPEIARTLGKGFRELKKATDDIKREMSDTGADVKKEFDEIKKDVENTKDDLLG